MKIYLVHFDKIVDYSVLFTPQLDFKVMCENAMIYNKPETIYYRAAKKLLHSGMKILSTVSWEKPEQLYRNLYYI